ncbi:MAG: PEP-CTERM sorting domain-containing protein [Kiritimatiellales bacterium]|nr:PEP-CTERM sorting domain-containing protein [Kiritimatiellales bacterium]
MRDGILHATSMTTGKSAINMMAGGTGDIVIDSLDTTLNAALYLNFETGNEGSFTFGQKTGGVSAGGTWQWLINNGQILIDGVVNTNLASYSITGAGLSSTIALIPEPATLGLIGLVGIGMLAIRRFVAL